MVIAKIIGGLGNQLFQYAAGRRLANVCGAEFKLDLTGFDDYALHAYGLNRFLITAPAALPVEIEAVKGKIHPGILGKVVRRLGNYGILGENPNYLREPKDKFDFSVLNHRGDAYMEGYWQNEKYFKDAESIIRREYRLKEPLSKPSLEAQKMIEAANSVSVHIRRADYLADKKARQIYATVGLAYYKAAISRVAAMVSNPTFFVFSDDISWAKENFKFSYQMIFMDFNGPERNYEDLYLMSRCEHHIIANSTFGWWGAWLCENPEKIVFAPERWFNRKPRDADRYPAGWMSVQTVKTENKFN
ncbi:MAG: alpha-1,2-fucosyltransferase [Patescibacteria group bacterium]